MIIPGWWRAAPILGLAMVSACGQGDSAKSAAVGAVPPSSASSASNTAPACAADGTWHECSVLESLEHAGLAPRRDSTAAHESAITQPGMLLHIGSATLEVFLFSDEKGRRAAEVTLDTTKYVAYNAAQTVQGERSLIRAQNLLAILDSRRDAQRERVGDALTAGAPQPHTH